MAPFRLADIAHMLGHPDCLCFPWAGDPLGNADLPQSLMAPRRPHILGHRFAQTTSHGLLLSSSPTQRKTWENCHGSPFLVKKCYDEHCHDFDQSQKLLSFQTLALLRDILSTSLTTANVCNFNPPFVGRKMVLAIN
jgi:hypothetical protein